MTGALSVFALLVVVFVSQSARFSKTYLTAPIIFLVAGGVVGRTVVDVEVESAAIRTLAEVALVLVLFHDAAELQPRELRADFAAFINQFPEAAAQLEAKARARLTVSQGHLEE